MEPKAVNSSGAASPATRAIARNMPVNTAGIDKLLQITESILGTLEPRAVMDQIADRLGALVAGVQAGLFIGEVSLNDAPHDLANLIDALGLFATALAYLLFGKGLRQIPLATAVTLSLAEPLTAGTLGVLLLGEKLSLQAGLGILMIFSGLIVLSLPGRILPRL